MQQPDFECVICQKTVGLRYYLCNKHKHYLDDMKQARKEGSTEFEWLASLINSSAAERMRWLSRKNSPVQETAFSDLPLNEQMKMGLDVDLSMYNV